MKKVFDLRLYVAGDGANSLRAVSNLAVICQEHLANRHNIEIIDVFLDPRRALADGVMMTPTLIRVSPAPKLEIVGDLSNRESTLQMLGLPIKGHA